LNPLVRAVRAVDRFQQRNTVLAFPVAVFKKFGDDEGGRLAALIAFYGFFSVFPLLLVFTSVLGFVLRSSPGLREDIVDSALAQFPVIGRSLEDGAGIDTLEGSWLGIVVGGAAAVGAGLGVAQAAQAAMNTVWGIPRADWPSFLLRRLRALTTLVLLGTIVVVSTFTSGFGASRAPDRWLYAAASWTAAVLLNLGLFTLAYQVLTARTLRWRNVVPGAVAAAITWTALQVLGGYFVTNQLQDAGDVYGTFALVIALLAWISLGAHVTLLCAEINVVWNEKLWPRSIVQPPLTEGDKRVYALIVERERMRPEQSVDVTFRDEG